MPAPTANQISCRSCRQVVNPVHTLQNEEGQHVCYTCIERTHISCSGCQALMIRAGAHSHRGELYCRGCARDRFRECTECDNSFHINELERDNTDNCICPNCMTRFVRCAVSSVLIRRNVAIERNGLFYTEQHVPVRHKIQRYNYKPEDVNFLGMEDADNLFFGVELEIEGGGNSNLKCDELLGLVNPIDDEPESVMYGKSDSSVSVGFEVVTHPASFNYHMNVLPWAALLTKAKELGYSLTPSTCGLHVHISRRYFGQSPVRQDLGTMKMLYLVEKFWDKLLIFSRRTQAQVDRWASRYGMKNSPKEILDDAKSGHGRYKAVNLENPHTLELRLFNGTLDPSVVRATIQFCHVLATTSKMLSIQSITQMDWDNFLVRASEYPELLCYMGELGLVPQPKAKVKAKSSSQPKKKNWETARHINWTDYA